MRQGRCGSSLAAVQAAPAGTDLKGRGPGQVGQRVPVTIPSEKKQALLRGVLNACFEMSDVHSLESQELLNQRERVCSEIELTTPVDLCDAGGLLNDAARGWSRFPIHRANLKWSPLRKKRWEYWCIITPDLAISVVLANSRLCGSCRHLDSRASCQKDNRRRNVYSAWLLLPWECVCARRGALHGDDARGVA